MWNRVVFFVFVCTQSFFFSSCELRTIRMYEGPKLQPEEIAILNKGNCGTVRRIDGKKKGMGHNIELLPGQHSILIEFPSLINSDLTVPSRIINFSVKAGHKYRIYGEASTQKGLTTIKIYDINTGEIIGETSISYIR